LPEASPVHSVLLVDDHPVTRLGLRFAFEREPDFEVCAEAADACTALDALARQVPALVVTDLALDGRSGLELVKQVRAHYPAVPVLVFSMHEARLYARRALDAGARGYVTKNGQHEEVIRAAREVLRGGVYLGEGVASWPSSPADAGADAGGTSMAALTDREFEVFVLLGQGYAPRHIAAVLCLSVSTVEAYRERLKAKLGLADAALLVRYAVRWMRDHDHTSVG
jgi:DNA-binding NarL/FixJ family response regulator